MKKIIASIGIAVMALFSFGGVALTQAIPSYAASEGSSKVRDFTQQTGDTQEQDLMPMIKTIVTVVLGILGVICVAMIIVGGIMYTTSQGDPGKVKTAKDIILYSIIGLVVALLAFAIVNFVLTNVFNQS